MLNQCDCCYILLAESWPALSVTYQVNLFYY